MPKQQRWPLLSYKQEPTSFHVINKTFRPFPQINMKPIYWLIIIAEQILRQKTVSHLNTNTTENSLGKLYWNI